MESKIIIGESSSVEFQVLERVFLDAFDQEKIRNVETSPSNAELQRVKELEHKCLNLWTEFLSKNTMSCHTFIKEVTNTTKIV